MVRWHERHTAIPGYLKSVAAWLQAIRKNQTDIRNTPNIKLGNDGTRYVDKTTDLDAIERSAQYVRDLFDAGEYFLARSSLTGLQSSIARTNERLTERAVQAHRASTESGRRSAEQRSSNTRQRDVLMAKEYLDLRESHPAISPTAAKAKIGKRHKLGRTAAITAVDRGLEIVRPGSKPNMP